MGLGHQQQFREEGAASTLNSIRSKIHQPELLNVAQTEHLYFNMLYTRGLLELAQASHENNHRLLQTLQQRFLEGDVDVVQVVQARTSLIQNQRARLDLLNELAQSAANLTAAAGLPPEELLNFPE